MNKPTILTLEAGTHFWCACGKSSRQPFCDGSHRGTGLQPVKFTLEEQKRVALCSCKHSQNRPFCDGAHLQHNTTPTEQ